MEAVVLAETEDGRTLVVSGSYHSEFRLNDILMVTDRDTWFIDTVNAVSRTAAGEAAIETEQVNLARVIDDFLAAVRGAGRRWRPDRACCRRCGFCRPCRTTGMRAGALSRSGAAALSRDSLIVTQRPGRCPGPARAPPWTHKGAAAPLTPLLFGSSTFQVELRMSGSWAASR